MRPIPGKIRAILAQDPYFQKCCYSDLANPSWHHVWKIAGRQVNAIWAILPLNPIFNLKHSGQVPGILPRACVEGDFCKWLSLARADALYGNLSVLQAKYIKCAIDFNNEADRLTEKFLEQYRNKLVESASAMKQLIIRFPQIMEW